MPLSYIVFLHQTTTLGYTAEPLNYCLISSFYIKPQLICICYLLAINCLISSFYIKPQLLEEVYHSTLNCLISSFYIKPQRFLCRVITSVYCLISSFYIKPQLDGRLAKRQIIVLYRLSTSNHNIVPTTGLSVPIVLYRLSTSNHNITYIFI